MKKMILISCVCLFLFQFNIWATTPNSVTIGDGTNDFDSGTENLGAESGRTGYLTWDATNLYIGIEGNPIVNTNSNLYVVIDTDPADDDDPRSGSGLCDQPTNESGGATYPFNADIVFQFFATSSDDASIQNPAPGNKYTAGGSWSSASISSGVRIRRHGSLITDMEIPWSELGLSADDKFNVIFYIANSSSVGSNFAQWPINNPNRNAPIDGNGDPLTHYSSYTFKDGITPNSSDNLSIRTNATGFTFGESSLANVALINGSNTYNAGSLTSITGNLYTRVNVTFSMGSNTAALEIKGNVINNGTLNLSTAIGGDLRVGGDFTNSGTFNCNERQLEFKRSV